MTVPCYGIIPARYASTRFPGKPLADLLGHPMFWHVWTRANSARDPHNLDAPLFRKLVLATDDARILDAARHAAIPCVMTSAEHPSGTDRVYEAASMLGAEQDAVIVNIQGDEPALDPGMLAELVLAFADTHVRVATLAGHIPPERAQMHNQVKVVRASNGDALYFSRAAIPALKDNSMPDARQFLGHIGLYAFRMEALEQFVHLPPSHLEKTEGLEQLRFLENGIPLRVVLTERHSHGVDTPEDLERARELLVQEMQDTIRKKL